jgi:hypothetical protein
MDMEEATAEPENKTAAWKLSEVAPVTVNEQVATVEQVVRVVAVVRSNMERV